LHNTSSIGNNDLQILINNLNPIFRDFQNKIIKKQNINLNTQKKEPILKIENGKLELDLDQTYSLIKDTTIYLYENKDKYISGIGLSVGMSISAGLLYSQIVKSYAKSVDSITHTSYFSSLNQNTQKQLLEDLSKNKSYFNR
jgi:hypothetical protein